MLPQVLAPKRDRTRMGDVNSLGVIQLRIPRTRLRSFLPRCIAPLDRRSPEVAELTRQAFLQGISTRQVGRVVAVVTGGSVQCADRLAADAGAGSGGRSFSSPFAGRRLGVSVSRRGVAEGAASDGAAASVTAGGLRSPAQWHAGTAGFYAGQSREPSGLGGTVERSVPAPAVRRICSW